MKISFENLKGLNKSTSGLLDSEVQSQNVRFGWNEIVDIHSNLWYGLIKETMKDPMIWFLILVGSIFIFVGQIQESIILFFAIIPLIFMDAFLHWRTQVSTKTLQGQLVSEVVVIRNGKQIKVNALTLVPGDLILVSTEQPFLPADGVWENADGIQVDESMLTGEAYPILKEKIDFDPFQMSEKGEIYINAKSFGYAGTRLLTGNGALRALFIGKSTFYGEIVQSVANLTQDKTPLQLAISKLVQSLIYLSFAFCILLAAVRLFQGYGWLDAILSAGTLAIAAFPEEFPVVFTFFLGVGVFRLAKRHALVRRSVSVENIGRITQICTDKTGTITFGLLTLTHIDYVSDSSKEDVLISALAASDPSASDPVDKAIKDYSKGLITDQLIREFIIPFTEDRKRQVAFVIKNEKYFCYIKGSPEIILDRSNISKKDKDKCEILLNKWASEGHKVLASAWREISSDELKNRIEPSFGFNFCGLMAFEDPPRPEVQNAMIYCQRNNIHVLMITGDHSKTALAIAKQVGLGGISPNVISAEENQEKFEELWLNDNPLFLRNLDIVARCNPLQKFRIVNALKKSGEVVAVTGDGVNDVPALKAADIGIAMGIRGTRSAKEVASIILADDNFNTIVNAIMEGKQLFLNLKMSFEYLLYFHIPFVLSAAFVPLMGYQLIYLPVHVVWLELIIHPTALFAFQQISSTNSEDITNRETFFYSKEDIARFFLIGLTFSVALMLIYITTLASNSDIGQARAKIIALLSLWSAGLVYKFTKGNFYFAKVMIVFPIVLALILIQVPVVSKSLYLSPLLALDWVQLVGVVIIFLFFSSINLRFYLKKIKMLEES